MATRSFDPPHAQLEHQAILKLEEEEDEAANLTQYSVR